MKGAFLIGVLPIAAGTAACDVFPFAVVCDGRAASSIVVEVVEEETVEPVFDALIWVQDGAFVDTLDTWKNRAAGPLERPGRYTVNVEHSAYLPWQRKGLKVEDGECHVKTKHITAKLDGVG